VSSVLTSVQQEGSWAIIWITSITQYIRFSPLMTNARLTGESRFGLDICRSPHCLLGSFKWYALCKFTFYLLIYLLWTRCLPASTPSFMIAADRMRQRGTLLTWYCGLWSLLQPTCCGHAGAWWAGFEYRLWIMTTDHRFCWQMVNRCLIHNPIYYTVSAAVFKAQVRVPHQKSYNRWTCNLSEAAKNPFL